MISLTGAKAELGKLNLRAANSPVQMNELVARDNVLTWHVSICVQKNFAPLLIQSQATI